MNWVFWGVGVPSTVLFWLALLLTWIPLHLPHFLGSALFVWCLVAAVLSPRLKPTEPSEGRVIYGLALLNLTWTMIAGYQCFQPPPNFALAPDQLPQVVRSHHAFVMALVAFVMGIPASRMDAMRQLDRIVELFLPLARPLLVLTGLLGMGVSAWWFQVASDPTWFQALSIGFGLQLLLGGWATLLMSICANEPKRRDALSNRPVNWLFLMAVTLSFTVMFFTNHWPKLALLPAGYYQQGPDDKVTIQHSGPNQFTVFFNQKPVQIVSTQTYVRYRGSLIRPLAAWAISGWFALMFFPVRPRCR